MSSGTRVVLIAGMHRSGTSLITRIANLVGVGLGPASRLTEPGRDNPAGYWENRPLRLLGEEVLERLGGTWDVPPPLPVGWQDASELEELRAQAQRTLEAQLLDSPGSEWVGWKDPRNSLLRPFWDTVRELDAAILTTRQPLAVAESLEERNGMPLVDGLYLWLRYTLTALLDSPGALLVDFDRAVANPLVAAGRIAGHLGLPEPAGERAQAIEDHTTPELRHHVASSGVEHPLLGYAEWFYAQLTADALPGSRSAALAAAEPIARGTLEAQFSQETAHDLRAELGSVRTELAALQERVAGLELQRNSIRDHRDKVASELKARLRQVEKLHHELDVLRRSRDAGEDALRKAFELVKDREARLDSMRESRDRWRDRAAPRS